MRIDCLSPLLFFPLPPTEKHLSIVEKTYFGEKPYFRVKQIWILIPVLLHICVIWGKIVNLAGLQFYDL